ncbi:unnamed protein product [Ectocarpus sp. CCAP 1310/34]|nr:unnamed protein product [Ectocarpus sp. CCAP 1310/34]
MRTASVLCALSGVPGSLAFFSPMASPSFTQPRGSGGLAARPTSIAAAVVMSHDGEGLPISRRSLVERVSATLAASAALITAQPSPAAAKPERIKGGGPLVTLEDGASYREMTIGDGPSPKDGDRVAVHYSLFYKGLEVESSRDSQGLAARPLGYTVGTVNGPGSVPPGLDEIVKGMRVGGRRKMTLPPQLAFGKEGRPPFIPPDATVDMDVSLWSVKPAGTDPNVTLPGSSVF